MSAAAAESSAPRLPRTFGPYTLFDFIGRGGMAEIYLARQRTDFSGARLCVVKQILPELAGDRKFSEMLVHEAKLAAHLNHANIVQVFDLGREDERLYIAMEYVEGFDLNEVLRRCARNHVALPFELSVHVIREALRGLDYAHRRTNEDGTPLGLVHRDVSPSNLLLSFHGEVKLCDFGIARANDLLGDGGGQAFGEALKGKAGYMSPEHARGEPIDAQSDVFAAGIVLWELATGRRMHKAGGTGEEALERARKGEVPELPETGLPEESRLRGILGKALSPHRDSRYSSAAVMLRDLEDYVAAARLLSSPLQLGDWLEKTFGEEILVRRRSRERAIAALERGPLVQIEPVTPPASSPVVAGTVDLGPPSSQPVPGAALAERPLAGARAVVVALLVMLLVVAAVLAMAKGR